MNIQEFSDNFDSLIRSYAVPQVDGAGHDLWGFDEYEKSIFLTQSQEQLVISLYNGKNTSGDNFERTEEMRRYLHNLVAEKLNTNPLRSGMKNYLDSEYNGMLSNTSGFKSTMFALPDDLWFITYEAVKTIPDATGKDRCNSKERGGIVQDVIPVTQDEFHRIKRNPFRGPSYSRALRLDLADPKSGDSNGVVEIISKYPVDTYYVRYIRKLDPIILVDLPDGLSVNGVNKATECKLHEAVHRDILEGAIRLAIASRSLNSTDKSSKNND